MILNQPNATYWDPSPTERLAARVLELEAHSVRLAELEADLERLAERLNQIEGAR